MVPNSKNTQSLQAVLAVAPLKKGKQLGDVRLFVCVSRTICVCKGEKWFRTFVKGTVRTERTIFTFVRGTVRTEETILYMVYVINSTDSGFQISEISEFQFFPN